MSLSGTYLTNHIQTGPCPHKVEITARTAAYYIYKNKQYRALPWLQLNTYLHGLNQNILGMFDKNKVCLYIGLSSMLVTLVLWVITLPKCTGGAPLVLLVLLLRCLRSIKGLGTLLAGMWIYN